MDKGGGELNPPDFNQQALGAFCPQTPFGSAWSDYWYYYINDPDAGFFKIAFMTFISDQTDPTRQSAYLHVAFFP
ncbi:MAG: hypothetical protein EOP83_27200, partial [Verrucomicrobiaceae bacterium]